MTHLRPTHPLMVTLLCCGLACASPTTDDDTGEQEWNGGYLLASVVITDVGRTTYFSVVPELDGHLTNDSAIEVPGNAVYLVSGNSVLIGLAEAPTWVKWEISETGELTQVGQLSLANYGLAAIDFGNTLVDETTAVSVSSDTLVAIIWDPTSMTITGTVDLSHPRARQLRPRELDHDHGARRPSSTSPGVGPTGTALGSTRRYR